MVAELTNKEEHMEKVIKELQKQTHEERAYSE